MIYLLFFQSQKQLFMKKKVAWNLNSNTGKICNAYRKGNYSTHYIDCIYHYYLFVHEFSFI